jgi:hypothetical protein
MDQTLYHDPLAIANANPIFQKPFGRFKFNRLNSKGLPDHRNKYLWNCNLTENPLQNLSCQGFNRFNQNKEEVT